MWARSVGARWARSSSATGKPSLTVFQVRTALVMTALVLIGLWRFPPSGG
jgi:hypothetical protein